MKNKTIMGIVRSVMVDLSTRKGAMMEKGLFNKRVYEVVRRIPKGKVATYGQVAVLAGAPRNARFVGYAPAFEP